MIKVSALYPATAGARFDMDYYATTHINLVKKKLGAACKGVAVEAGMSGATADSPATFVAMGHLLFDSVEAFGAAFGPHADAIMGDIPNYTDIAPVIQVSEVKL
jgi:uncharacterized protein (TIGR02118 family)